MRQRYFVAGTDTEVGKTRVSCGLLNHWREQGNTVLGIKSVAAGAENGFNEDGLALQKASDPKLDYELINPICLPDPISPNLTAHKHQIHLSAASIIESLQPALETEPDKILVEGAGGWLCPINDHETLADVAVGLGFPVILVVGLRLGCLNHTLLSYRAIVVSGLRVAGWVANTMDPDMLCRDENVAYLNQAIDAPLLADIPYLTDNQPIEFNRESIANV